MAVKTYQPGNAIVLRDQTLDTDVDPPELVDPDTVTIDLWDPLGVQVVTAQNMTRESMGVYKYIYQSLMADEIGAWTQMITTVRGSFTNRKKSLSFILSVDPVG